MSTPQKPTADPASALTPLENLLGHAEHLVAAVTWHQQDGDLPRTASLSQYAHQVTERIKVVRDAAKTDAHPPLNGLQRDVRSTGECLRSWEAQNGRCPAPNGVQRYEAWQLALYHYQSPPPAPQP